MPRFQSGGSDLVGAADRARSARPALAEQQLTAVEEATNRYERERAGAAG